MQTRTNHSRVILYNRWKKTTKNDEKNQKKFKIYGKKPLHKFEVLQIVSLYAYVQISRLSWRKNIYLDKCLKN